MVSNARYITWDFDNLETSERMQTRTLRKHSGWRDFLRNGINTTYIRSFDVFLD